MQLLPEDGLGEDPVGMDGMYPGHLLGHQPGGKPGGVVRGGRAAASRGGVLLTTSLETPRV